MGFVKSAWLLMSVVAAMVLNVLLGCSGLEIVESGSGVISLSIDEESLDGLQEEMMSSQKIWSAQIANLDTNDFNLSIYSQSGSKVYDGKYGKRPGEIVVAPGAYDVKLYSRGFNKPQFDSPQYGCEQTIMVEDNSSVAATLGCKQVNSGIKLSFSDAFKKRFKGDGISVKDVKGKILYPYSGSGFCYVTPGVVELLYNNGVEDTLLFSRQLDASQMLSLDLEYAPASRTASLKMDFDTVRSWNRESFNAALKIPTGAFTIEQAKAHIGEKNVMVFGFILGGDATETTLRVGPPFKSRTNIVIAPNMKERNRNNMFVVELPTGEIREALNLVVNSKLLGSAVVITGNIVDSYYGYPGIKSTKAYSILY